VGYQRRYTKLSVKNGIRTFISLKAIRRRDVLPPHYVTLPAHNFNLNSAKRIVTVKNPYQASNRRDVMKQLVNAVG